MSSAAVQRPISRYRAASIHLGISAAVVGAILAVVYFVWYPPPLFGSFGGENLFLLIGSVDLTLGPFITLIIFSPGKKPKLLKLDLAIIGVCQLAALSFGTWVLFQARPVWMVYVKDRYELVRANQIYDKDRAEAKAPFDALSITGPRLAGARVPKDPNMQLQIALTAPYGHDLQTYPQYLVPYDEVRKQVSARAQPIEGLKKFNPGRSAAIEALPAKLHLPAVRLGFLPVRAERADLTAIVDRTNGDYLGLFDLRPWQY